MTAHSLARTSKVAAPYDNASMLATASELWNGGVRAERVADTVGLTIAELYALIERNEYRFAGRKDRKTLLLRQPLPGQAEVTGYVPGLDALAETPRVERPDMTMPGGPIPLVKLTERTCKWPVDGGGWGNRLFCGASKDKAGSYCATHAKLAYTPRTVARGQRPTLNP